MLENRKEVNEYAEVHKSHNSRTLLHTNRLIKLELVGVRKIGLSPLRLLKTNIYVKITLRIRQK